jgi:alpha-methylacyl-CoA racemase
MSVGSEGPDSPQPASAAWLGSGPLTGLRILEIAGVGPVTFCGMLFANLGAEVVRISRPADARGTSNTSADGLAARRPSLSIDLRSDEGKQALLALCERADALVEGMRPGVMERLGVGPQECLARNPRLVYGRVSGFGRNGAGALAAGHDIDYLALSGALWLMRDSAQRPPTPPLNLIGDYGGGAMTLAFGVVCALLERQHSGRGQVVDTSILQGVAVLMSLLFYSLTGSQDQQDDPAGLITRYTLTGSGPFYRVYETSDGKYMAVGAVEEPFYHQLLYGLGLDPAEVPSRDDPANWPALVSMFREIFAARTRDEWEQVFSGSDACVAPVLTPFEAPGHPRNIEEGLFTAEGNGQVPQAAPLFGRTHGRRPSGPAADDRVEDLLAGWNLAAEHLSAIKAGPVVTASPGVRRALRRDEG